MGFMYPFLKVAGHYSERSRSALPTEQDPIRDGLSFNKASSLCDREGSIQICEMHFPATTLIGEPDIMTEEFLGETLYWAHFDSLHEGAQAGRVKIIESSLEKLEDILPKGSGNHERVQSAMDKIFSLKEAREPSNSCRLGFGDNEMFRDPS